MSAILESSVHPVAAQALEGIERGHRLLANTFMHVPEDKLNYSPSPTAKSALRIAAHCAVTNFGIAQMLRGGGSGVSTFAELFAAMETEELKITTREQAIGALEASCQEAAEAIRQIDPDAIGSEMGEGELRGPTAFFMNLPGLHMSMHSAQIDYIETIWGDMVPHFGG